MNQFQDVINKAAETEDHTKETESVGKLIPKGNTVGRLVSYIELGTHKQEYNGKAKPDCELVRVEFELLHPNMNKNEANGKVWYDRIGATIPKKTNGRAKFFKLMKQMTYGRDITHMSQMLGELFRIEVKHLPTKNDPNKMYATLFGDETESYSPNVMSPYVEKYDDLGNVVSTNKITLEALGVSHDPELKLFIWSNPTMECWNSIFIDGTYTDKVDGIEVTKSKNKWQDMIMESPGFPGSATEDMLSGAGQLPGQDQLAAAGLGPVEDEKPKQVQKEEKPADDLDSIAEQVAAGEQKSTANGSAKPAGQDPAQGAETSTAQSGADALAAMGL